MEDPRLEQVKSHREYYGAYHHHKELMAYAAAVLYLGAAVSLVFATPEQQGFIRSKAPLVVGIIVTAVLGFLFVVWQLRNRRIAALIVEACQQLLTRSFAPDETKDWKTDARLYYGQLLPHFLVDEAVAIRESRRGFRSPLVSEGLTYIVMATWALAALWPLLA